MLDEIGFIGLGVMGLPMARNLAAAGLKLRVWNRSPEKCRCARDEQRDARRHRRRGSARRRHHDHHAGEQRGDRRRPRARHQRFRRERPPPHHREHEFGVAGLFVCARPGHWRCWRPLCGSAGLGIPQACRGRPACLHGGRRSRRHRAREPDPSPHVPGGHRLRAGGQRAAHEARRQSLSQHHAGRAGGSRPFRQREQAAAREIPSGRSMPARWPAT